MKKSFRDEIKDTFKVDTKKEIKIEPEAGVKVKSAKSDDELRKTVKENSVCGSCLSAFQNEPIEVKVKEKFLNKKVVGYQCNACASQEKPLRVVIAEAENEQGIIEIPVKQLS